MLPDHKLLWSTLVLTQSVALETIYFEYLGYLALIRILCSTALFRQGVRATKAD